MTGTQQLGDEGGADVTRGSGDEDAHVHSPFMSASDITIQDDVSICHHVP
jgi:hypothetical protein